MDVGDKFIWSCRLHSFGEGVLTNSIAFLFTGLLMLPLLLLLEQEFLDIGIGFIAGGLVGVGIGGMAFFAGLALRNCYYKGVEETSYEC